MSAPICTWPSCKCTARDQCKGLGVRADLCEPTQDERVMALIDLLRIDPWAIGWREWMLRRSTALRALERGEDR